MILKYHAIRQLIHITKLPKLIIIGFFVFIISSCSNNASNNELPTLIPFPTEVAEIVTEEAVQLVVETEEPGQTPEVAPSEIAVRPQNEDQTLFVRVTAIRTAAESPTMPEAPAGEQYLVLTTNLANFTGEIIMVEASSLTLIDEDLNRYPAIAPDDFLNVPIFGIELTGNNTSLGSVRFAIPEDATPYLLEWCPYNDCEVEMFRTLLP